MLCLDLLSEAYLLFKELDEAVEPLNVWLKYGSTSKMDVLLTRYFGGLGFM